MSTTVTFLLSPQLPSHPVDHAGSAVSSLGYIMPEFTQAGYIFHLLAQAWALRARLGSLFDLVYVIAVNGLMFMAYSRHTAPRHFSWQTARWTRVFNNSVLVIHILVGLAEILRWHVRALFRDLPDATTLDLVLALMHSVTNLLLVKDMARGRPTMTRPSYQAGAFLRSTLTFVAWKAGIPAWHRASVKALNSFAYARLLVWGAKYIARLKSGQEIYNLAIFGSAILAISEGGLPYATPIYVAIVAILAFLNRWSTYELRRKRTSKTTRFFLTVCAAAGLMELEGLRSLVNTEGTRPYDEYTSGADTKKIDGDDKTC